MLRILNSTETTNSRSSARIGLAIAGGGPLGAIFELGALRALEDSMEGIDFTGLDAYVGVSAGAFIAAGLANQLPPSQMCRIFVNSDAPEHPFKPDLFLQPAFEEYWRRASMLPKTMGKLLWDLARHPFRGSLSDHIGRFSKIIPAGLFDNERLHQFLKSVFEVPGRTNDFRQLEQNLIIVAVDIDNGASIRFGSPGYDHVPIAKAVQASAALPGLYPPVQIDDRQYVDGALRRTLHASAALDQDIDLLIGLNPLVPYDGYANELANDEVPRSLAEGGLPLVLSQTFRSMIQSRMQIGMEKYQTQYPKSDLLLLEPDRDDSRMFFTNVFSYSDRHELCEHAFQMTRADILSKYESLRPLLHRHGIELNIDRLKDKDRTFTAGLDNSPNSSNPIAHKLDQALDELSHMLKNI